MVAPLRVQQLGAGIDPADAFVVLFGDAGGSSAPATGDAVWLDAGPGATHGRSILGTGRIVLTSSVADGTVTLDGRTGPGDILSALREDLASRPRHAPGSPLGWFGVLGYEAGAAALGIPVAATAAPDAAFLLVDRAVVFDHTTGTAALMTTDDPEALAWGEDASRRLHTLRATPGTAAAYERAHPVPPASATWRHTDAAYLDLLAACQSAIRAGDAYQLCLTNTATAATAADPLAVHLRLRRTSPAPHAGLLRIQGRTLVSSSPEQFLLVTPEGRVRTRPIKGTRPRGATVAADLAQRAELEASEKEQAENVMIVDLMRNDLGRVCEVGSVAVTRLLAVESYAQVHQLVSTVEGRLQPGLGAVDAVAACFPAGSMTGAPKLSAMRILHDLEAGPRGAYAGCFGRFGLDGGAELAMVIRSVVLDGRTATIGAGGGITALSVPAEEVAEVRVKARALLAAIGAGNATEASRVD
ncbi:anthranilate synthase component I family protein [Leifsonia sp. F6_8S_P_1B]|uniref:Anthranilate synthase component I family protein n=1 Tax=Leifsonia williamsii TaxID=3035919 RepID=A0ABT8KCQ0_9MICO|nr:anthranilate synthase component I family protein [Leifsonia williamsii]MDN4615221.1 anthranilate synthase component I family protein [Leifsonia williamsii]